MDNGFFAERTTYDDLLDGSENTVLLYGRLVLVAARFYRGSSTPRWAAAIYSDLLGDPKTGELWLDAVSPEEFEDNGHAAAWAIQAAQN